MAGIEKLLANGTFIAAFPLHDGPLVVEDGDSYDRGTGPLISL